MIELSIHFTADEKDPSSPIDVRLFRADTGNWTEPVDFEPPLDDDVLADLRWYLETFSSWPTGPDYKRAERIAARMEDWGRALLKSVTPDRESAQVWRDFVRDAADSKLVTIDAVDPRVLRLPWELLADEGGHLFSAGIGVRRRLKKFTHAQPKPFDLPVRVLVVVSRPKGAGFIDPRAVSRPLLDALDGLGERVVTEFLYPPTLKALTDRLRASTGSAQGAAPPVHVVHFDGHGVYDARLGLGYLLFENDAHQIDRVDANRLGTLLNRCGVPLMVLNACQSAAQEEADPYASVAARLIRAGVGSVLAMNYSVLVEAARRFVGAFYGGLAGGLSVGQAVDEGRYALYADVERHTITRRDEHGNLVEKTVTLRDWFLPALYQQSTDPVVFSPERPQPTSPTSSFQPTSPTSSFQPTSPTSSFQPTSPGAMPGALPDPPRHGFHGRAREMLKLERTLAERRVVVLHGFGGMGKTALAAEAGRWFHRTGRFPGGAAFVSFEHGGSLDQLCSWVAQAISGDEDYLLHKEDPVAAVARLLRERPALVILDNFESVIGPDPLIPSDELQAILDAVWSWVSPATRNLQLATRFLITTRDTTFNDARFAPSKHCAHLPLSGLATRDALELAAAVLDDHGIDRAAIPRQALVDLMAHLGGHPLSLYLVLPHLREHSPAELTARFEELLPGFVEGKAVERNESLAVSLEFSLRRLGEETRAALPDLAVFQGGCLEATMLLITGISPDLWEKAKTELAQAALVSIDGTVEVGTQLPDGTQYNGHFVRFHPTLAPYLATRLDEARRAELEERYWQRYYALANYLYHTDSQHPHQARAIALRELPNLRHALDLALQAATSPPVGGTEGGQAATSPPVGGIEGGQIATQVVEFATSIAKFLDNFCRWRERDVMMREVASLQVGKSAGEEGLTKAEFLLLDRQGDTLLQQGRAAEAERLFRGLLERLESEAVYDADYDRAMTLGRLGRCLAAQGWPAQAIEYHERALERFERIGIREQGVGSKEMVGRVYTGLGDNLTALGRFDEAQEAYESGLDVSREMEDHRTVGVTLGQLGTLALRRGELQEAARRYTEALETFRRLGEPQMEAVAWHQLGMVAQEQEAWDEAERCYREALKLAEQQNDLPGVADTCNQLALVAEGDGRPADAERWYLRAQELKDQVAPQDASTLNNLANLYLSQGRLEEAASYARRALKIKETLDLSAEPWTTYYILAQIAEARGRAEEAARWWRKEQESYAASAFAAHKVREWMPVIQSVVAACDGNIQAMEKADAQLREVEEGWPTTVAAVHRILAGERDIEALRGDLTSKGFVVVHTILAQLSGEAAPTPPPPAAQPAPAPSPEGKELSLEDLFQMVALACAGQGPPDLGEQLYALTQQLSRDPNVPAGVRALGGTLNRILCGDRDPDLSALPPELAAAVRRLLGAIG